MICDHCGRVVYVAPGYFNVSVPHVVLVDSGETGVPCNGNEKRVWRDQLEHRAERLARQYAVLDDDSYWEGL